jgi:multiple sugar transport system ATP-binding protein
VRFAAERLEVDEAERARHPELDQLVGGRVIVGIRPEHLRDASLVAATPNGRHLMGLVRLKEALGSEIVVHFQIEAAPAVRPELAELTEDIDESRLLQGIDALDQDRRIRRSAFVGRFDAATRVVEDASARIAVAPGALRFFRTDSGAAVG